MALRIGNNDDNTPQRHRERRLYPRTRRGRRALGFGGADYIAGGRGDDDIFGGNGLDVLFGGAGDDRVFGQAGADVLVGGQGEDRLNGGTGNDVLDGGADNDVLIGGLGFDILEGGEGADRFRFESLGDSQPGVNRDLVLDFDRFEGDEIDLRALNLDASDISKAVVGGDTVLRINSDNDAAFESVIRFDGITALNLGADVLI